MVEIAVQTLRLINERSDKIVALVPNVTSEGDVWDVVEIGSTVDTYGGEDEDWLLGSDRLIDVAINKAAERLGTFNNHQTEGDQSGCSD